MAGQSEIKFGVVGVCGGYGRGGHLVSSLRKTSPIQVHAVCDVDPERMARAQTDYGIEDGYCDFDEMLDKAGLDAVLIATPMHLHVPQSIAALERGIHVLCEVTAAVAVDECKDLVAACKASDAVYMMGANYMYGEAAVAVAEMVRRGVFGTPYYAEGGYVADAKGLAETTPWRRKWQLGISGITYGSHNLSAILGWMPGERIVSVCCSGTGQHYRDPRGDAYADDSSTMLCKTSGGCQIVIRSDFISSGPGMGVYNLLQGTEGVYASRRFRGEPNRLWLQSEGESPAWSDLHEHKDEFLPDWWKEAVSEDRADPDSLQARAFVDAILGNAPNPVDVHRSLDLTLPGLVSQLSIQEGGCWMEVPDSRLW